MRKAIAFLTLFLLGGCSTGTQIEDLALILGTGIDEKEKGMFEEEKVVTITSEVLNTETEGGQEKGASQAYFLESISGKTINDAISKQKLLHPKEVSALHNKVVVFGESVLQNGITEIVSEFTRIASIRGSTYIVGVKGKAYDLLKSSAVEEKSISDSMVELINRQGIKTKAIEILEEASGKPQDSVVPLLDTMESEGQTRLMISGAAVLSGGKLAGYLNHKEMELVALLQNQKPILGVKVKVMYKNKPVEVVLGNSHFKLNSVLSDNKPKFIFNGVLTFNVDKAPLGGITTSEDVSNVELLTKKELNRKLTTLTKKIIVKYQCDALGLGNHLYRFRPSYWKKNHNNWGSSLPEVDVDFKTDVTIKSVGLHG